ncbi:alpha-xenorhabdolysin family binary toxin subunit A [Saccharopolyspora shandongensis]|uniref:alpha-xenorhabdolysin family binary toxin subunit A n=1 Tax=Saccharopolyspora shandongensis TaxID=418495 RepID=UPI0033C5EF7F
MTSVEPSKPLTILNGPVPHGVPKPPDKRFIVFGQDWLTMQTYIKQALALPINKADWEKDYGGFPEQENEIKKVLSAMKNVQDLCPDFGDPDMIRKKIISDGAYLTGKTPPAEIYGHIIWLSTQVSNTAGTFKYTFESLKDVLSTGTEKQRADNLRLILGGSGGLLSEAEKEKKKVAELGQKLAKFDQKITEANNEVAIYTSSSSKILTAANKKIGALETDVKNLHTAADEAYEEWRKYTIVAVSTSVGITVISLGLLASVGWAFGIGFGIAAIKARKLYNQMLDQIKDKEADIQKKTRLVTDLTGLNSSIPSIGDSLTRFKNNLQEIEGVWTDIAGKLGYICSNYQDKDLANLAWVQQSLKILDAQHKWAEIQTAAQEFTQRSLVTFSPVGKWGNKLTEEHQQTHALAI